MPSILLRRRLHWYALATGRLVLRRWQALLLALAVLAPAGASALSQAETLGWPVLVLLAPEHGPLQRYALLCLYQALAVMWALMQRDAIDGGDFMRYAQSLPLSPVRIRAVDVLVLLTANSPLILFPAAALYSLSAQDASVPAFAHCLFITHLLVLAVFAQLACLERAYPRLGALALANLPLAAAPGAGPTVQLLLLALTLPCAWLTARYLSAPLFQPLFHIVRRTSSSALSSMPLAGRHPAACIPLHYLLRQAPAEAIGKLAAAAAITAAALALMALWVYDDRIVVLAVIVLGVVAFVISGLYRDLQMAHRAALPLVAGLPLPPNWARRFDHAVLMLAGTPFAALVCGTVAYHRPQQLLPVLLLGAAFFALVGVLRLPQVHTERQTVVLGSVIATLWAIVSATALF
ncbi:MAG: hypothetical protein ACRYGO_06230 [Janthinobacterium lividum]